MLISGSLDKFVSGISFDSRKLKAGQVFVAIQGLESNGTAYQKQAFTAGAAAIVSDSEQVQNSIPFIQVKMPASLWHAWQRNFMGSRIMISN